MEYNQFWVFELKSAYSNIIPQSVFHGIVFQFGVLDFLHILPIREIILERQPLKFVVQNRGGFYQKTDRTLILRHTVNSF